MKSDQTIIQLTPMRRDQSVQVAAEIAGMSRELIEHGLGWGWRSQRVLRQLRRPDTIVLIAHRERQMLGFGIMRYNDRIAHLLLLAVKPEAQRQGVGAALLTWLEDCAQTNGCGEVVLEVVAANQTARAFYDACGFAVWMKMPRYYRNRVAGLRMGKRLISYLPPTTSTSATSSYELAAQQRLHARRADFRASLNEREGQVWDARMDTKEPTSLATMRTLFGLEAAQVKEIEVVLTSRWQAMLRAL